MATGLLMVVPTGLVLVSGRSLVTVWLSAPKLGLAQGLVTAMGAATELELAAAALGR